MTEEIITRPKRKRREHLTTNPLFRNLFPYEKQPYYLKWNSRFLDEVAKYSTPQEASHAYNFMRKMYSNAYDDCIYFPFHQNIKLTQMVTVLVGREDCEKYLLANISTTEKTPLSAIVLPKEKERVENKILAGNIGDAKLAWFDTSFQYSNVKKTFEYLYKYQRQGIYVCIKNNKVHMFVPFVNDMFRNAWGPFLSIAGKEKNTLPDCLLELLPNTFQNRNELSKENINVLDHEEFYERLKEYYRWKREIFPNVKEMIEHDVTTWYSNANILDNVMVDSKRNNVNVWGGDSYYLVLKDMLTTLCNERSDLPDCEFFVNRRDYPQFKYNREKEKQVFASGFLFNRNDLDPEDDLPLYSANDAIEKGSAIPIFSFYVSKRFLDIGFPVTEDWQNALKAEKDGEIFIPQEFRDVERNEMVPESFHNTKKVPLSWDKKKRIAIFRGSSTGGGNDTKTNQRLHLAQISYDWERGLEGSKRSKIILDAKITSWDSRDRKFWNRPMSFINCYDFEFYMGENKQLYNMSMEDQMNNYRFVIYVQGHSAANRYGTLMSGSAVIFKVESTCIAKDMWFFPELKGIAVDELNNSADHNYDHVIIKGGKNMANDLKRAIGKLNQDSSSQFCERMVGNANALHEQLLSKRGILDYIESLLMRISNRDRRSFKESEESMIESDFNKDEENDEEKTDDIIHAFVEEDEEEEEEDEEEEEEAEGMEGGTGTEIGRVGLGIGIGRGLSRLQHLYDSLQAKNEKIFVTKNGVKYNTILERLEQRGRDVSKYFKRLARRLKSELPLLSQHNVTSNQLDNDSKTTKSSVDITSYDAIFSLPKYDDFNDTNMLSRAFQEYEILKTNVKTVPPIESAILSKMDNTNYSVKIIKTLLGPYPGYEQYANIMRKRKDDPIEYHLWLCESSYLKYFQVSMTPAKKKAIRQKLDLIKYDEKFQALRLLFSDADTYEFTNRSSIYSKYLLDISRYVSMYFRHSLWTSSDNNSKTKSFEFFYRNLNERNKTIIDKINDPKNGYDFMWEYKDQKTLRGTLASHTFFNYDLATPFKPAYAKAIYLYFYDKLRQNGVIGSSESISVLDPCSGWGDRMLGAMSSDFIGEYVGVDPNVNLLPGYARIANEFGFTAKAYIYEKLYLTNSKAKRNITIINQPFENTNEYCPYGNVDVEDDKFHIVFTSPPFFNTEQYSNMIDYGSNNSWETTFYEPLMKKALNACIPYGYVVIYMDNNAHIFDSKIFANDTHELIRLSNLGFVGVQSEKVRGIYVYQKVLSEDYRGYRANMDNIINKPLSVENKNNEQLQRSFNVIQEGQLVGGSKQRLMRRLLETTFTSNKNNLELIYASTNVGYAHLAFSYVSKMYHRQAHVFINEMKHSDNIKFPINILVEFSSQLGAIVNRPIDSRNLINTKRDAQYYVSGRVGNKKEEEQEEDEDEDEGFEAKKRFSNRTSDNIVMKRNGRALIQFAFFDAKEEEVEEALNRSNIEMFKIEIEIAMLLANVQKEDIKRMWLVLGSGILYATLTHVLPDCEFHLVGTGHFYRNSEEFNTYLKKYCYQNSKRDNDRFHQDISRKAFDYQYAENLPPDYDSVPWYDAHLWQFFEKDGQDGDYIWNVAASPTTSCDIAQEMIKIERDASSIKDFNYVIEPNDPVQYFINKMRYRKATEELERMLSLSGEGAKIEAKEYVINMMINRGFYHSEIKKFVRLHSNINDNDIGFVISIVNALFGDVIRRGGEKIRILEIGLALGTSTICILDTLFSMLNKGSTDESIIIKYVSIDPNQEKQWQNYGKQNVAQYLKSSKFPLFKQIEYIQQYSNIAMEQNGLVNDRTYDLIFVDGSHEYHDVYSDLVNGYTLLNSGGVMIMDDVKHEPVRLAIEHFLEIFQEDMKYIYTTKLPDSTSYQIQLHNEDDDTVPYQTGNTFNLEFMTALQKIENPQLSNADVRLYYLISKVYSGALKFYKKKKDHNEMKVDKTTIWKKIQAEDMGEDDVSTLVFIDEYVKKDIQMKLCSEGEYKLLKREQSISEWIHNSKWLKWLAILKKYGIHSNSVIGDIGGGEGSFLRSVGKTFKIKAKKLICFEPNHKADDLSQFQYYKFNERYITYDDSDLSQESIGKQKEGSFSVITCMVSMHHIKEIENLLANIYKLLKVGGFLIIKEHDRNTEHSDYLIKWEHYLYHTMTPPRLTKEQEDYNAFIQEYTGDIHLKSKKEWNNLFQSFHFEKILEFDNNMVNCEKDIYYYTNPTNLYWQMWRKKSSKEGEELEEGLEEGLEEEEEGLEGLEEEDLGEDLLDKEGLELEEPVKKVDLEEKSATSGYKRKKEDEVYLDDRAAYEAEILTKLTPLYQIDITDTKIDYNIISSSMLCKEEELSSARNVPLNEKEQAIVRKVLQKTSNRLLFEQDGFEITTDTMYRLNNGKWLNDTIIDFYCKMLNDRDQALSTANPSRRRSYFFNSYFITKLFERSKYTFNNVKRWTKHIDKNYLLNYDKLYFPINIDQIHWVLAVIHLQDEKRIEYYDSLGGENANTYLKILKQWLNDEFQNRMPRIPIPLFQEVVPDNIPRQSDGYNCGVFVIMYMDFLSDNLPFKYFIIDASFYRKKIAFHIIKTHLSYPICSSSSSA
jgi:SAM-dependent methyltransferase/predicted O-methyltransferase YrrM